MLPRYLQLRLELDPVRVGSDDVPGDSRPLSLVFAHELQTLAQDFGNGWVIGMTRVAEGAGSISWCAWILSSLWS